MSLASFKDRWPENVVGRYYVHSACLDCAACTEIAPEFFTRFKHGYAFVARQPVTEEEERKVQRAVRECPVDAIADDGMLFDWKTFPATAFLPGGSNDPGVR